MALDQDYIDYMMGNWEESETHRPYVQPPTPDHTNLKRIKIADLPDPMSSNSIPYIWGS